MANNKDVLKKYTIQIDADTTNAKNKIDEFEKKLSKTAKTGGSVQELQSDIESVKETIDGLKASLKNSFKGINEEISKIGTDKLKSEISEMKDVITDSMTEMTDATKALQSSIDSLNSGDFSKVTDGISKALNDLTSNIATSISSLTNMGDVMGKILDGSFDPSKLVQNEKQTKKTVSKVSKELKGYVNDLYTIFNNKKFKIGNLDKLEEFTSSQLSTIQGYVDSIKKLAKAENADLESLLQNVKVGSLKQFYELDETLSDIFKRKERTKNKRNVDAININVKLNTDKTEEEIEKVANEISGNVIEKVNKKLENAKPINVPIDIDTKGLKDKIIDEINDINLDIKSGNSSIPEIEIKVRGVVNQDLNKQAKALADEIQKESDLNITQTQNGKLFVSGDSGIATESTLSSIKDILSDIATSGLSIQGGTKKTTQSSSTVAYDKIAAFQNEATKGYIGNFIGNREVSDKAKSYAEATENFLTTLQQEQETLNRILEARTAKNIDALKETRLWKETTEVNGKKYSTYYRDEHGNAVEIEKLHSLLERAFVEKTKSATKSKVRNSNEKKYQAIISQYEKSDVEKLPATYEEFVKRLSNINENGLKGNKILEVASKFVGKDLSNVDLKDLRQTVEDAATFSLKLIEDTISKRVEKMAAGFSVNGLEVKREKIKGEYKYNIVNPKGTITSSENIKDQYLKQIKDLTAPFTAQVEEQERIKNVYTTLNKTSRRIVELAEKESRSKEEELELEEKKEYVRRTAKKYKGSNEEEQEYSRLLEESLNKEYQSIINKGLNGNITQEEYNRLSEIKTELSNNIYEDIGDVVKYARSRTEISDNGKNYFDEIIDEAQNLIFEIRNQARKAVSAFIIQSNHYNDDVLGVSRTQLQKNRNIREYQSDYDIFESVISPEQHKKDLAQAKIVEDKLSLLETLYTIPTDMDENIVEMAKNKYQDIFSNIQEEISRYTEIFYSVYSSDGQIKNAQRKIDVLNKIPNTYEEFLNLIENIDESGVEINAILDVASKLVDKNIEEKDLGNIQNIVRNRFSSSKNKELFFGTQEQEKEYFALQREKKYLNERISLYDKINNSNIDILKNTEDIESKTENVKYTYDDFMRLGRNAVQSGFTTPARQNEFAISQLSDEQLNSFINSFENETSIIKQEVSRSEEEINDAIDVFIDRLIANAKSELEHAEKELNDANNNPKSNSRQKFALQQKVNSKRESYESLVNAKNGIFVEELDGNTVLKNLEESKNELQNFFFNREHLFDLLNSSSFEDNKVFTEFNNHLENLITISNSLGKKGSRKNLVGLLQEQLGDSYDEVIEYLRNNYVDIDSVDFVKNFKEFFETRKTNLSNEIINFSSSLLEQWDEIIVGETTNKYAIEYLEKNGIDFDANFETLPSAQRKQLEKYFGTSVSNANEAFEKFNEHYENFVNQIYEYFGDSANDFIQLLGRYSQAELDVSNISGAKGSTATSKGKRLRSSFANGTYIGKGDKRLTESKYNQIRASVRNRITSRDNSYESGVTNALELMKAEQERRKEQDKINSSVQYEIRTTDELIEQKRKSLQVTEDTIAALEKENVSDRKYKSLSKARNDANKNSVDKLISDLRELDSLSKERDSLNEELKYISGNSYKRKPDEKQKDFVSRRKTDLSNTKTLLSDLDNELKSKSNTINKEFGFVGSDVVSNYESFYSSIENANNDIEKLSNEILADQQKLETIEAERSPEYAKRFYKRRLARFTKDNPNIELKGKNQNERISLIEQYENEEISLLEKSIKNKKAQISKRKTKISSIENELNNEYLKNNETTLSQLKDGIVASFDRLSELNKLLEDSDLNQNESSKIEKEINTIKKNIENSLLKYISSTGDYTLERISNGKELLGIARDSFSKRNSNANGNVSRIDEVRAELKVQNSIKQTLESELAILEKQAEVESSRDAERAKFQKGIGRNKDARLLSSSIDDKLIQINSLLNNKPEIIDSQEYEEWLNYLRLLGSELFNLQDKAKEIGLVVSDVTGRAFGGKTDKSNELIPGVVSFAEIGKYISHNIDNQELMNEAIKEENKELSENQKVRNAINEQIRKDAHDTIQSQINEQTKQKSLYQEMSQDARDLYNVANIAAMNQEQADLTLKIKEMIKQINIAKNASQEQKDAMEKQLIELQSQAVAAGLSISKREKGKGGYAYLAGYNKRQFLLDPMSYADNNSYVHNALYSESGKAVYDGLATELTLQKILAVIQGKKFDDGTGKIYTSNKTKIKDPDSVISARKYLKDRQINKGNKLNADDKRILKEVLDAGYGLRRTQKGKGYLTVGSRISDEYGVNKTTQEYAKTLNYSLEKVKENTKAQKENANAVDKDTNAKNINKKQSSKSNMPTGMYKNFATAANKGDSDLIEFLKNNPEALEYYGFKKNSKAGQETKNGKIIPNYTVVKKENLNEEQFTEMKESLRSWNISVDNLTQETNKNVKAQNANTKVTNEDTKDKSNKTGSPKGMWREISSANRKGNLRDYLKEHSEALEYYGFKENPNAGKKIGKTKNKQSDYILSSLGKLTPEELEKMNSITKEWGISSKKVSESVNNTVSSENQVTQEKNEQVVKEKELINLSDMKINQLRKYENDVRQSIIDATNSGDVESGLLSVAELSRVNEEFEKRGYILDDETSKWRKLTTEENKSVQKSVSAEKQKQVAKSKTKKASEETANAEKKEGTTATVTAEKTEKAETKKRNAKKKTNNENGLSLGNATTPAIEQQNKLQEELKETQVQAKETKKVLESANEANVKPYNQNVKYGLDRVHKAQILRENNIHPTRDLLLTNKDIWNELKKNGFLRPDLEGLPENEIQKACNDWGDAIMAVINKYITKALNDAGYKDHFEFTDQLEGIVEAKHSNWEHSSNNMGWTFFNTKGYKNVPKEEKAFDYKIYASLEDITKLNKDTIELLFKSLSDAGYVGGLKTARLYDTVGQTDQIVLHGRNAKDQEIAYKVLQEFSKQYGIKLGYLGGGFDTTSKGQKINLGNEVFSTNKGRSFSAMLEQGLDEYLARFFKISRPFTQSNKSDISNNKDVVSGVNNTVDVIDNADKEITKDVKHIRTEIEKLFNSNNILNLGDELSKIINLSTDEINQLNITSAFNRGHIDNSQDLIDAYVHRYQEQKYPSKSSTQSLSWEEIKSIIQNTEGKKSKNKTQDKTDYSDYFKHLQDIAEGKQSNIQDNIDLINKLRQEYEKLWGEIDTQEWNKINNPSIFNQSDIDNSISRMKEIETELYNLGIKTTKRDGIGLDFKELDSEIFELENKVEEISDIRPFEDLPKDIQDGIILMQAMLELSKKLGNDLKYIDVDNAFYDLQAKYPTVYAANGNEVYYDFFDDQSYAVHDFSKSILENRPELVKAMSELAKIPEETIRKALQIESPSKVMQELGYWTDKGFANGISENSDEISKSLEKAFKENKITQSDLDNWLNSDEVSKYIKSQFNNKIVKSLKSGSINLPSSYLSQSVQNRMNSIRSMDLDGLTLPELKSLEKKATNSIRNNGTYADVWKDKLPKIQEEIKRINELISKGNEQLQEQSKNLNNIDSIYDVLEEDVDRTSIKDITSNYKTDRYGRGFTDWKIKDRENEYSIRQFVNDSGEIETKIVSIKKLDKALNDVERTLRGVSRLRDKGNFLEAINTEYVPEFAKDVEKARQDWEDVLAAQQGSTEFTAQELQNKMDYIDRIAKKLHEFDNEEIGMIDPTRLDRIRDQLEDFAYSTSKGHIEIGKLAKKNTELTYTVRTADNMVKTYALTWDKTTGVVRKSLISEEKYVSSFSKALAGLTGKFQELIRYTFASLSVREIIQFFKQGINVVKEMDSAMTELKKVSNESVTSLEAFRKESYEIANTIGSTGKEIVNSAASWEKLGYSIAEASVLAKNSALYANVGDMDIDTATEHMVSTLQAFQNTTTKTTEELSNDIVDKFNQIGNNYAITSQGIGEAMENSAAALVAANNDLDQSIALITAGNLISQDASSVGNALKVVSLRLRGSKSTGELEEMGEEVDNLVASTSKLRSEIMKLSGVDIMLDEKTYKSTYDIINELSQVWDKLSDVSQANVLEKLAGKTRASVVAGLIENGEKLNEIYEDSVNAEGSAMRENETYMASIEGHLSILQNKWQEMWDSAVNADVINFWIDLASSILDVVNNVGLLNVAIPAVTTLFATKFAFGENGIKFFEPAVNDTGALIKNTKEFKNLLNDVSRIGRNMQISYGDTTKNFKPSKLDLQAIEEYNGLIDKNGKALDDLTISSLTTNKTTKELITSANGAKISMTQLAASETAATIASTALNAALTMGIGLLVGFASTAIINGIDSLIHEKENLAKAAEEATNKIQELNNELKNQKKLIGDVKNRYAELAQGVENLGKVNQSQGSLSTEEYKEFLDISEDLVDAFPQLYGGMDSTGKSMTNLSGNANTITSSLEHLLDVERQLANQEIADSLPDIFKDIANKYSDANDEISKTTDNLKMYQDAIENIRNGGEYTADTYTDQWKVYENILKSAGISTELSGKQGELTYGHFGVFDFSRLTEEEMYRIESSFGNLVYTYEQETYSATAKMNKVNSELQNSLYSYLYTTSGYYELASDDMKNLMSDMISDINYEDLINAGIDLNAKDVNEQITKYVDDLSYNLKTIAEKSPDNYNLLNSFISGDLDYDSFNKAFNELYEYLTKPISEGGLGLDKDNALVIRIKTSYKNEAENVDSVLNHIFSEASVGTTRRLTDEYRSKIYGLDETDRQLLLDLSIPEGVFYSWEELMDMIHQTAKEAEYTQSTISTAVKNMNTQIEPQLSQLGSLFSSLFTYDDNGKNITGIDWSTIDIGTAENIRKTFEELEDEIGFTFDEEYVNSFFDSLATGEADVESVRQAFNDLATEYYYTTSVLKDLNDETAETIALTMKNQGVVNAYDVANYNLAVKALEELEDTDNDFTESEIDNIYRRIDAYVAEIEATDETIEALFALQVRKFILSNGGINTAEDCNQLLDLAESAGYAGEYVELLVKLRGELAQQKTYLDNGAYIAATEIGKSIDSIRNELANFSDYKFELDIEVPKDKSSSSAGSAGKDAAEEYNDAFEKELDVLEYLRDNDFIDEKEYLDQKRKLIEKYYKNNDKYAKEYYEKIHEYLEGVKELYEEVGSGIQGVINDQIDAYKELSEKRQKEIEEEKDAAEKAQQALIDAKQEEIDQLEKERQARQQNIDLQKAQYELERSQHQRTRLVNFYANYKSNYIG